MQDRQSNQRPGTSPRSGDNAGAPPMPAHFQRNALAHRNVLAAVLAFGLLAGCDATPDNKGPTIAVDDSAPSAPVSAESAAPAAANERLAAVLATQPPEIQARYGARHPEETLTFFGIEPGMTVAEADPGGGWYTGILRAYLGKDGTLIGADYPMGVYRLFNYYSEDELIAKASWAERWPLETADASGDGAALKAHAIGSMPAALEGSVDVFLLVRALHNLADYEDEGAYMSDGLAEVYRALKPGGVVGVVQHSAPEAHSDDWASGGNGYLKKSFVVAAMEAAGFVFEDESDVNANPADMPTEDESVWRLAPTLEPVEDETLASAYKAVGESNRMTLRFRKPRDA
jgi:predicted methyltransferase